LDIITNSDTQVLAHFQFIQAITQTKNCKRVPTFYAKKNYFLKFPSLLKFLKPQPAQPTQMKAKATIDRDYSKSTDRTPSGNSVLVSFKTRAVQYSADSFVIDQTLVLRINPDS